MRDFLNMGLEIKTEEDGLAVIVGTKIDKDFSDILDKEQKKELKEHINKISEMVNDAIKGRIKEITNDTIKEMIKETDKEEEEKESFDDYMDRLLKMSKEELDKERERLYNNLKDEDKRKMDDLRKRIDEKKTIKEKLDVLFEEMIKDIEENL